MAQTRANVIDNIESRLQDITNAIFTAAAIAEALDDGLVELAVYSPYEAKETLTTVASSYDIDISSITDLIKVRRVEWEISKSPRQFNHFTVYGTTLTQDVETAPTSADSVYVYCDCQHALVASPASSTLNVNQERLLCELVTARMLMQRTPYHIDRANAGIYVAGSYRNLGKEMLDSVLAELRSMIKPNQDTYWYGR